MDYEIFGDNLQMAVLEFEPQEIVYAEAGAKIYMSDNVSMEAKTRGGIFKGLKRKLTGESFFQTEFSASGGKGIVAVAGNCPGKIIPLDMRGGRQIIA